MVPPPAPKARGEPAPAPPPATRRRARQSQGVAEARQRAAQPPAPLLGIPPPDTWSVMARFWTATVSTWSTGERADEESPRKPAPSAGCCCRQCSMFRIAPARRGDVRRITISPPERCPIKIATISGQTSCVPRPRNCTSIARDLDDTNTPTAPAALDSRRGYSGLRTYVREPAPP
jgi:hypothetical protein